MSDPGEVGLVLRASTTEAASAEETLAEEEELRREISTAVVEAVEGESRQAGGEDSLEVEAVVEEGLEGEQVVEVVEELVEEVEEVEVTQARSSFTARRRMSMTRWRDTMTGCRPTRLWR